MKKIIFFLFFLLIIYNNVFAGDPEKCSFYSSLYESSLLCFHGQPLANNRNETFPILYSCFFSWYMKNADKIELYNKKNDIDNSKHLFYMFYIMRDYYNIYKKMLLAGQYSKEEVKKVL